MIAMVGFKKLEQNKNQNLEVTYIIRIITLFKAVRRVKT